MTTTADLLAALQIPTENFTEVEKWSVVRTHRNILLSRCDWTQIPDAALTLEEREAWAVYRQTLRNLPEDFPTPDQVVFPQAPGGAQ